MNAIKNTTKTFVKGLFNPDNKLSLIPNWLSFSRVIGGIAIPIMAYTKVPLPFLLGNVTFLAISDFLDGKAARLIAKEETKEGAMLDAVSDKIFSVTLILGILPVMPIFAINGVLEGTIALINAKLLSKGGKPKSNFFGKVKIWPLSVALILGYLALANQSLNLLGISNETLITLSTALSISTVPLQLINIKQYSDTYKKQIAKNISAPQNETEFSNENELDKENNLTNKLNKEKEINQEKQTTAPKLALSKDKHQAIVYELEKTNKEKTKPKTLQKKPKDSNNL